MINRGLMPTDKSYFVDNSKAGFFFIVEAAIVYSKIVRL